MGMALELFFSSLNYDLRDIAIKHGAKNWLVSYAFLRDDPEEVENLRELRKKHHITLMLDCGAFTVQTKGITITREDYLDFVLKNVDLFDIIIGLDVMHHPEQTFDNCEFFRKNGIMEPMICFHIGEDFEWLKKFIDNFEFLGIGGIAAQPVTTKALDDFFADFFRYFTDEEGRPIRRVHALGIARWKLFYKYPFYSTDSTVWMEGFRTATIFTDDFGPVLLSDRDESMGKNKKSFLYLRPEEQEKLLALFRQKGYSYDELRSDANRRTEWNIEFLMNFVQRFKEVRYRDNRIILVGRQNEVLYK
jgi:hypothetical protein